MANSHRAALWGPLHNPYGIGLRQPLCCSGRLPPRSTSFAAQGALTAMGIDVPDWAEIGDPTLGLGLRPSDLWDSHLNCGIVSSPSPVLGAFAISGWSSVGTLAQGALTA